MMDERAAIAAARAVKKPEFVSRLNLHLDVRGYNKPVENDPSYIIRRAMLLRSMLEEKCMLGGNVILSIDSSVLYGLLKTKAYKDGARSIDRIIMDSTLRNGRLNRSSLPRLDPYLDVHEFEYLVQHYDTQGKRSPLASTHPSQDRLEEAKKRELSKAKKILQELDPHHAEEELVELLKMLACVDDTWDVQFFADLGGLCDLDADEIDTVLTVTESAQDAVANTAAWYAAWRWPKTGNATLNLLSEILSGAGSARPSKQYNECANEQR
jgi:hypothetical protein